MSSPLQGSEGAWALRPSQGADGALLGTGGSKGPAQDPASPHTPHVLHGWRRPCNGPSHGAVTCSDNGLRLLEV